MPLNLRLDPLLLSGAACQASAFLRDFPIPGLFAQGYTPLGPHGQGPSQRPAQLSLRAGFPITALGCLL